MKITLQTPLFLLILSVFYLSSCNNDTAQQADENLESDSVQVENLAGGLNHPWGMVFLPDGRLLVTERSGDLRILDQDNNLSEPVSGVPEVFAKGQGGMLDIALDPDFTNNQYVYLSFAEPGADNTASTAVGRGLWQNDQIQDFEVLFSQEPKIDGPNHFGGRIEFSPDGYLFLTLGERFQFEPSQNLTDHLGTIIRINRDGSIPEDNPFVDQSEAEGEIWSYGHRNIEAAAFDPNTGDLWITEMGPRGGDEFNRAEKGKNYGWPVVSWGEHYSGEDIPDPPTHPEFADAKIHWTPVISPSGQEYYTGDMFPEFQGQMLIGGLTAQGVVRVQINGEQAEEVGRIELGARIRDVDQAPDGSIYVLTDQRDGNVWRLYK
ncbi:MAG: PQQ-dependent sugar dehydrogenase [Candidatus Cyclobacteriaceae bacterium M3_2C_046]